MREREREFCECEKIGKEIVCLVSCKPHEKWAVISE